MNAQRNLCPSLARQVTDVLRSLPASDKPNHDMMPSEFCAQIQCLDACRTLACQKAARPSLVVYGHYPLPVIQEPETKPWAGPAKGREAHGTQGSLLEVLKGQNVSAYFSGHLHAAFGQRVHGMHRAPGRGGASRLACIAQAAHR